MLKKLSSVVGISLIGALLLQSCGEYKKTDNGLQYKIIKDSTGKNVEVGGVALVHMKYFNEKDTFDTYKQNFGQPIDIRVPASSYKGSLEEGLTLLSEGDSAVFLVSTDSLYTRMFKQPLPKEIKPGTFTTFNVKVDKVYTKAEVSVEEKKYKEKQGEMKKQQMAMYEDYVNKMLDSAQVKSQIQKEQVVLQKKLTEDKGTAQKTDWGVLYSFQKNEDSPQIQKGDTVSVNYTGKLLDGTVFDSSEGRDPFTVEVGVGKVIPGWDNVLQQLSKGDKVTVYIPSPLAYGAAGAPDPKDPNKYVIPKNAPLIFDIEVVDVKK